MKGVELFITVPFFVSCSLLFLAVAHGDRDVEKPRWKRPSLWQERTYHTDETALDECECPPPPICEPTKEEEEPSPVPDAAPETTQHNENCALGFSFYKKFLIRLFEKSLLETEYESKFLVRNVQLKITPHQLETLTQSETVREIDGIISSVVEQSKDSYFSGVKESFCWSMSKMVDFIGSNIYLYFMLIATIGPLVIYMLLRTLSRIMKVHPVIVLVLMILLVSYAETYRECNLRLETKALDALNGDTNPCMQNPQKGGDNVVKKCQEYLRISMSSSTICDPSTVAIEMFAKLQLHYFNIVIHKMLDVFKSSTANSGWFESILTTVFICALVGILVLSVVKYGMYGSATFFAALFRSQPHYQTEAIPAGQQNPVRQSVPATPITLNINLATLLDNNRIEEIADRGNSNATRAIQQTAQSSTRTEDGSGDAPEENTIDGLATPIGKTVCDDESAERRAQDKTEDQRANT